MLQSSSPVPGTLVNFGERRAVQRRTRRSWALERADILWAAGEEHKREEWSRNARVGIGAPSEPVVREELIREDKVGTREGAAGQASQLEGPASTWAWRQSHRRGSAGRERRWMRVLSGEDSAGRMSARRQGVHAGLEAAVKQSARILF